MAVSLSANVQDRRSRRDNHTAREGPQSTPLRPRDALGNCRSRANPAVRLGRWMAAMSPEPEIPKFDLIDNQERGLEAASWITERIVTLAGVQGLLSAPSLTSTSCAARNASSPAGIPQ